MFQYIVLLETQVTQYTYPMNYSKKTLTVVGILLFGLGFFSGRLVEVSPFDAGALLVKEKVETVLPKSITQNTLSEATTSVSGKVQTSQSQSLDTSSVAERVIEVGNLTENQKKMLETFGVDTTSLTVTKEMITCATAKLGEERLKEIMNGETPAFLEGAALFGCYAQ